MLLPPPSEWACRGDGTASSAVRRPCVPGGTHGARAASRPLARPRAVDTQAFANALVSKGYGRLVIQKGAGDYAPRVLVPPGSTSASRGGLEVE